MTLRAACKRQLARLPKNLANGPDNEADQRAYIDAFERHVASEEHAKKVTDSLIETCQFYPKICDLVAACQSIDPLVGNSLPPGCDRCCGEPWVSGSIHGYECAMRCDCLRGQYLRARDKDRAA